jgi:hypothetical protein
MNRIGQTAFVFLLLIFAAGCGTPPATTCTTPVLLSRGAPVTASAHGGEAKAITDGTDALWNAGGYPPQWVEIDLGSAAIVHHIDVVPEQKPAGHTEHRVTGAAPDGQPRVLGTLSGDTQAGSHYTLNVGDEAGRNVRKVRIDTTETPSSWVAWHEIEVYGCR